MRNVPSVFKGWKTVLATTITLVFLALTGYALLKPQPVIIESVEIPLLTTLGYNPQIIRAKVLNEIADIERNSRSSHDATPLALDQILPDFQVPATGLSLKSFLSIVQPLTGTGPTRVHVRVTPVVETFSVPADRSLYLIDIHIVSPRPDLPKRPVRIHVRSQNPDILLAQVSREILRLINPFFIARAAYLRDDDHRTLEVLEQMLADRRDLKWAYLLRGVWERAQPAALKNRPQEALSWFQKAIEIDPDFPNAYVAMGDAHNELAEYDKAIQSFDRAIALDREFSAAYNGRGVALVRQQHFDEALVQYKLAIQADPENLTPYRNIFGVLNRHKRESEAIDYFNHLIQDNPRNAVAHDAIGNALAAQNQFFEAREAYVRALAINPRFVEAYTHYHEALKKDRIFVAIINSDIYLQALRFLPREPSVYQNYQELMDLQTTSETTLERFQAIVNDNPRNSVALEALGNALGSHGRTKAAIAMYREALLIDPAIEANLYRVGTLWDAEDRVEDAFALYQMMIDVARNTVEAYSRWGYRLLGLNRKKEAFAVFQRALETQPEFLAGFLSFAENREPDLAIRMYQLALQVYPRNALAYEGWATVLHKAGRNAEAIPLLKRVTELRPDDPRGHFNYGNILIAMQRWAEAVPVLKKAVALNPSHLDSSINLAASLYHSKRYDQAIEVYKKLADNKNDRQHVAYLGWSSSLIQLAQYEESIAILKKLVSLYPNSWEAYNSWSLALRRQGKHQEADEKLQRANDLRREVGLAPIKRMVTVGALGPQATPLLGLWTGFLSVLRRGRRTGLSTRQLFQRAA